MKRTLLILGLIAISLVGNAQELKYKSAFTLNFIRYIGWSDEQTKGDFVIGVVGKPDLVMALKEQSAGRKFGYQDIVIKQFASVDKIIPCQVIYIGKASNYDKFNEKIIKNCGGKNFLLITESPNSIEYGSIINFVLDNDVIKFEISESNANKLGVTYNSKLSSMSSAIKK